MMLRYHAARLQPQIRRHGAKPFPRHIIRTNFHGYYLILARSSRDTVAAIREAVPHIEDEALQQAIADYPDLIEVDEDHIALWLMSAASLLKLKGDEVQSFVCRHPWLLISDLLAIKSMVTALTRVMSVEEVKVARMALSYPDVLELEPMDLMEHLAYISSTTGMSYDTIVQLTLACPAIALTEPRDVVRAWAEVRSCCNRGEVVEAAEAAGDAMGTQSDDGKSTSAREGSQMHDPDPVADDLKLGAEVAKVLSARPELLVMCGEEIRRSLAPVEATARPPPPPPSTLPPMVTRTRPRTGVSAPARSKLTASGARPPKPSSPSVLLRKQLHRRRASPENVTKNTSYSGDNGGSDTASGGSGMAANQPVLG